jgi:inward rectifier potassium channel
VRRFNLSLAPRRQKFQLDGIQAVKVGGAPHLSDLYYRAMEMSWPAFVGAVTAVFLLTNLLFGAIYAAMPAGSIANAVAGSVLDGFFFSVETLATVGYGNMAPIGLLAHGIATGEILIGLFFSATVTGLIFARFARPRDSLIFSDVAVIDRYEGRPALMVRLASTRARPLADATAQMAWVERVQLADGRDFRRLVELPLVRTRNPRMDVSWTLVHLIEEGSPFLKAFHGDDFFKVAVSVAGLDTLLANQSQGGRSYSRDDIRENYCFADIVTFKNETLTIDLTLLHDVVAHKT